MDVFDLVAKIRVDDSEYNDKVGKAKGTMSTLVSGVGKGLATVAKVGAAAVSAGAAGVAALTKMGVEGYAQYEQLASGMEKIFSSMDTTKIAQDAANAYKNIGMSASEYLAIINDVGASFAATMGDEAGYEAAKKGLTAISDYASGTGKNFDELQQKLGMITRSTSSYQSIADQFSGILPATSEGFLQQAQAAGVLESKYRNLTDVPIEEYQRAVTDMLALGVESLGLTGNTAAEAATTIEGSLNMMKSAWQNLVVGMADPNADIGLLISNMVDSATAAAQNLLPAIERALSGIGELITNLAPIIAEAIPTLVETVLPTLITAGVSLVTALVNGIIAATPEIYQAFLNAIYMVLTEVFGMSEESAHGFVGKIDGIIQDLVGLFQAIKNALASLTAQAQTEGTLINAVWESIKTAVKSAVDLIQGIIVAFTQVLQGDWEGAWNTVVETVINIGSDLYDAGVKILEKLWEGLKDAWNRVKEWWDGLSFGDKEANVNVNSGGNSHATGLNFVPYDGYSAILHRGEAVLTAAEARVWRNGGYGATPAMAGGITINQYIQSVPQSPVDLANTTEAYFEQARWML